ncbi:MAG: Zn-ribbon domain-containing OB-fold protein [Emcibacter sp.]|nr:Zn-ribbon domain-containing OB-fold protein [Emcibacter sp.]
MLKIGPQITPETESFWVGVQNGEFKLQNCKDCSKIFFPPRFFCPSCGDRNVNSFAASGKGVIYSYVINHRPRPDWPDEPYCVAIVELEEGIRLVSNIVNIEQTPDHIQIGMPVKLCFEKISEGIVLPVFEPVDDNVAGRN